MRQEIRVNGSNSKIKRRKIHRTKYKRNIEEKNIEEKNISCYSDGYQKHKRETSLCYDYIHFLESDFEILKKGF